MRLLAPPDLLAQLAVKRAAPRDRESRRMTPARSANLVQAPRCRTTSRAGGSRRRREGGAKDGRDERLAGRPDSHDDRLSTAHFDRPILSDGANDEALLRFFADDMKRAVREGGDGCVRDERGDVIAVDEVVSDEGVEERSRGAPVVLSLPLVGERCAADPSGPVKSVSA